MSQSDARILVPVNSPTLLQRHRALRWLAPTGVVAIAAVAALMANGAFGDTTSDPASLPAMTPSSLLAEVQTAEVTGLSGTVVSSTDLGLPSLPTVPGVAGTGTSLAGLLTGSHTMRVWFGGAQQQRVALLGANDEIDIFRNGQSLWQWSSASHTAVHLHLPDDAGDAPLAVPSGALASVSPSAMASAMPSALQSVAPSSLARRALAALDPTTQVQVRDGGYVADRPTYELVLTPRTSATLVGSVHVAVDGATKVPLAVQVYPRGSGSAAIDVSFTAVRFTAPPERNFSFSPPADAKVRRLHTARSSDGSSAAPTAPAEGSRRHPSVPTVDVTGSGWTRIAKTQLPKATFATVTRNPVYDSLAPVSGSWGSGRLLTSRLTSALLTDDGHLYAGAVDAASLFAAAARH